MPAMTEIFIDADACPVKEEIYRVASRHELMTHVVSNGGIRPPGDALVNLVIVPEGPDAADDWIAARIGNGDIAVTADIPLAARCIDKGAQVLKPNGEAITEQSVGLAVANRDLMTHLRETGDISGGPRPFSKGDRSRFLNALETAVQSLLRGIS